LKPVVWTRQALNNLESIRDYVAQFNPWAAKKLAAALEAAGNGVAPFPNRGRAVSGTNMREITTVHPYVIRYRVEGDTVFILRIRHTARRPTKP